MDQARRYKAFDEEFYQQHLSRVSRSFSFCIDQLGGPEKVYVGASYLICRILDTVEDTHWENTDQQNMVFNGFESFFNQPPSSVFVQEWLSLFQQDLVKPEEWKLLEDVAQVFFDFHQFPDEIKQNIQQQVLTMAHGMRFFSEKKVEGQVCLRSLKEVNQYCFYVAGVVGELLTKIFSLKYSQWRLTSYLNAFHFGLFLQKVNLLKDQLVDENEGRNLVPDRSQVYKSIKANALGSFRYLESIPLELKNYRLFCAWSLFIGLQSLPVIQEGFKKNVVKKLSRTKTLILVQRIKSSISHPTEIKALFDQLLDSTNLGDIEVSPVEVVSDHREILKMPYYSGDLTRNELVQLGVF
ncbi:MAG: squalene/phytoene synthase family protein [Bdellovibrionales bacterium]|nr:squalene/phytoene synthase family protein [Bdellovibrionales bacterium]